jgi:hypothetical protein
MYYQNRTSTRIDDGRNYAEVVTLGDGRVRLELGQDEEVMTLLACDLKDYDGLEELANLLQFWVDVPEGLQYVLIPAIA